MNQYRPIFQPPNVDDLVKSPSAAYCQVRRTPQELCALHLELFTLPSTLMAFYEIIKLDENGNFGEGKKPQTAPVPFQVKAGAQSPVQE
ncbi:MAG: hypothetical protein NTY64_22215 [Deltaproteobacteria bacterium]|nr:hypothetical protein [Deltaproteobacteria bacterium]